MLNSYNGGSREETGKTREESSGLRADPSHIIIFSLPSVLRPGHDGEVALGLRVRLPARPEHEPRSLGPRGASVCPRTQNIASAVLDLQNFAASSIAEPKKKRVRRRSIPKEKWRGSARVHSQAPGVPTVRIIHKGVLRSSLITCYMLPHAALSALPFSNSLIYY